MKGCVHQATSATEPAGLAVQSGLLGSCHIMTIETLQRTSMSLLRDLFQRKYWKAPGRGVWLPGGTAHHGPAVNKHHPAAPLTERPSFSSSPTKARLHEVPNLIPTLPPQFTPHFKGKSRYNLRGSFPLLFMKGSFLKNCGYTFRISDSSKPSIPSGF